MNLTLRDAADTYDQVQRVRIAAENRVRAVAQGTDDEKADIVARDELVEKLAEAEAVIQRQMEILLAENPTYDWIMGIGGINRTLAAKILGMIDDPRKFASFSNLRTFAGLTPGRNKLVRGEKAPYSTRLKKYLFLAFDCILKQGHRTKPEPAEWYVDIYYKWREIYCHRYGTGNAAQCKKKKDGRDYQDIPYHASDEEAQAWPDLRQHLAAKNKLLDVLLFHVYEEWLTRLGEDVRPLYVHEILGHHQKYDRHRFTSAGAAAKKIKKHAKLIA